MAILTGILLWLGLSPWAARLIYTHFLMPRCRSESPRNLQPVEIMFRPVKFASGGVYTLCGHVYTSANSQKLVVYYGGRRSNQVKNLIRANALLKTGVSVFTFDYRGFGDAEGRASVSSLLEDGLAAYDAVISMGYRAEQIVLYGESLGAAVAAHVSSKRSSCGLVLQSGFSSLEVQIKDMIPLLRIYPRFMFPDLHLSTVDSIRPNHPPLLILHGDNDSVVDKKHSEWLAKAAGPDTRLVVLPGATHKDVHSRKDWFQAVSDFFVSLGVEQSSQVFSAHFDNPRVRNSYERGADPQVSRA
jgi:alpha-beta hydrolase superfamily lysophospholipase